MSSHRRFEPLRVRELASGNFKGRVAAALEPERAFAIGSVVGHVRHALSAQVRDYYGGQILLNGETLTCTGFAAPADPPQIVDAVLDMYDALIREVRDKSIRYTYPRTPMRMGELLSRWRHFRDQLPAAFLRLLGEVDIVSNHGFDHDAPVAECSVVFGSGYVLEGVFLHPLVSDATDAGDIDDNHGLSRRLEGWQISRIHREAGHLEVIGGEDSIDTALDLVLFSLLRCVREGYASGQQCGITRTA